MIAWLVITDGRDSYLNSAVESGRANLQGSITERWMYDDTGDDAYRARLAERFPDFEHINGGPRQGFGGAIQRAWGEISERSTARFVFHHEADFTFNQKVDLDEMAGLLQRQPHLAQVALRRQPWNAEEIAAGGIVEQHPDDYTERSDDHGAVWLEHRRFFTTNPCLYRRTLCERDWPSGDQSEGRFGIELTTQEAVSFAFWSSRDTPPLVHHIGEQRAGTGY